MWFEALICEPSQARTPSHLVQRSRPSQLRLSEGGALWLERLLGRRKGSAVGALSLGSKVEQHPLRAAWLWMRVNGGSVTIGEGMARPDFSPSPSAAGGT